MKDLNSGHSLTGSGDMSLMLMKIAPSSSVGRPDRKPWPRPWEWNNGIRDYNVITDRDSQHNA